jgi:beta-mannosidase
VAELDPTRPYSPGSPYSISPERHPNDPEHGTMHVWDVWNQVDYTGYRAYRPRFVTEFGFQGPPTWPTLTRAVHDDPLTPDSPGMRAHQKAEKGRLKLAWGLAGHLPEPMSFDDWHWATSLNQARAVALGIEHFRSLMPHCMGAVVWQLNDCWPVTSWAAVDGDGRRKPLWYALRRSFRDRLLTFQPRPGTLALVAVNDSDAPWSATVEISRRGFDGTVLAGQSLDLDVAPRSADTVVLPGELVTAGDPTRELLVASTNGTRAWWHFAEDLQAALPAPDLDTVVARADGGYQVTVTARSYVHDLALLADRVGPGLSVDDMLLTLLPGVTVTFRVTSEDEIDPALLTDPRVLRSANQLVHVGSRQA